MSLWISGNQKHSAILRKHAIAEFFNSNIQDLVLCRTHIRASASINQLKRSPDSIPFPLNTPHRARSPRRRAARAARQTWITTCSAAPTTRRRSASSVSIPVRCRRQNLQTKGGWLGRLEREGDGGKTADALENVRRNTNKWWWITKERVHNPKKWRK